MSTGNVFSVSKASCTTTSHVWREDLDMDTQKNTVLHHQKVRTHQFILGQYKATCASQEHHRAFLAALIDESRRYNASQGLKVSDAHFVAAHKHVRSHMESTDAYPKLVQELSSLRMFSLGTTQDRKKSPNNE